MITKSLLGPLVLLTIAGCGTPTPSPSSTASTTTSRSTTVSTTTATTAATPVRTDQMSFSGSIKGAAKSVHLSAACVIVTGFQLTFRMQGTVGSTVEELEFQLQAEYHGAGSYTLTPAGPSILLNDYIGGHGHFHLAYQSGGSLVIDPSEKGGTFSINMVHSPYTGMSPFTVVGSFTC